MDNNNSFLNGLSISEKEKLENYMYSVLGEEFYVQIEKFFDGIFNSHAKYKVFLARKCLNLMYLFYCKKSNQYLSSGLQKTFYTDSSILACAEELAEFYGKNGFFPEIMIVDDILVYGRNLGMLISGLVCEICNVLENSEKQSDAEIDRTRIEDSFLASLTIRVLMQNNKPMLINTKYYQCVTGNRESSKGVQKPQRWHELSSRTSLLLGEAFFANTSFVLSLRDKEGEFHTKFENVAQRTGFAKYEWEKRFSYHTWVKNVKNDLGNVVACYTLRITQNSIDGGYRIIPFVIMSNVSVASIVNLSAVDISPEGKELFNYFPKSAWYKRLSAEALYLVLSHNLLLLLQQEIGGGMDLRKKLDTDKVRLGFNIGNNSSRGDFVDKVANLEKPIMSWEQMENFIIHVTKNASPLFDAADNTLNKSIDEVIENVIAQEGFDIERQAFREYSKKVGVSATPCRKNIIELLKKIGISCDAKFLHMRSDVVNVVGALLRLADYGCIKIGAEKTNENAVISCVCRAGEQSQFIYPKRYMSYIPVLAAMEKDCLSDSELILQRIERLYQNEEPLKGNLMSFVRTVYEVGQRISDWNINLMNWTEVNDKIAKKESDDLDELNNRLIFQMMLNMKELNRNMEKYRELYPEEY